MKRTRAGLGWTSLIVGLCLATAGVFLNAFAFVARFQEGSVTIGLWGWSFTFVWLGWVLLVLGMGAGLMATRERMPGLLRPVGVPLGGLLAVAALALLTIQLIDKPSEAEFGGVAVSDIGVEQLEAMASRAMNWTQVEAGLRRGVGLYLAVAGALAAIAGSVALTVRPGARSPAAAGPSGDDERLEAAAAGQAAVEGAMTMVAGASPAVTPSFAAGGGPTPPAPLASSPAAAPATAGAPASFCVRCGAPFGDSAHRFCTRCGAPRRTS